MLANLKPFDIDFSSISRANSSNTVTVIQLTGLKRTLFVQNELVLPTTYNNTNLYIGLGYDRTWVPTIAQLMTLPANRYMYLRKEIGDDQFLFVLSAPNTFIRFSYATGEGGI